MRTRFEYLLRARQRTRRTLESGDYWHFEYDGLGQVAGAEKRQGNNTPWPGFSFEWAFDDIGNRETSIRNSETSIYTANSLNHGARQRVDGAPEACPKGVECRVPFGRHEAQYSQRTVPGVVEVSGTASAAATVTVDDESVTRVGAFFFKQLLVNNTTGPVWEELTVRGVVAGAGMNSTDAIAEDYVTRWLPQTPEAFTYDDDGNLMQDGRWEYDWNAENRLTAMETREMAYLAGVPRVRLEFAYDSQGRRVQKTHLLWDEGENDFVESSQDLFLYDHWLLVAELSTAGGSASADLNRRYVWGLDVSGSLQGAGGVGGLLMVDLPDNTIMYPAYDGNGNVMGLFDPDGDEWVAEYEYGSFGEPLKAVGEYAADNPFRFSTKYMDAETDLVCYGFRYYDPETGRWLNRDPIGEQGGPNLYGFVGNDGMNGWDMLGLVAFGSNPMNNPRPALPPGPSMLDHFFPPIGPDNGDHLDYTEWFNQNHSADIERYRSWARREVTIALNNDCSSHPTTLGPFNMPSLPEGQSFITMQYRLGRVLVILRNVTVSWTGDEYTWTGEITLGQGLGFNNNPDGTWWERNIQYPLFGNPRITTPGVGGETINLPAVFPPRSVTMGQWSVDGSGSCCRTTTEESE